LAFARFILHDSSIGTVTLLGAAGTGKSTMAIHAAVELLLAGDFSSIEIYKSTHQIKGQPPIAAVPGNAEQKFASFRKTVETTLQKVLRDLSPRIRACIGNNPPANGGKGKPSGKNEPQRSYCGLPIQILSPAFLRGEDFEKKCIILEEAQNFTSDMILTAGTRLSHQSRLFVVGDQKQVDNPNGNEKSNGLTDMMNRLKGRDLYGQVELTACLRKGVAKMFIDAYYNT
jgi:PhoH-like ATPase